MRWTRRAFLGDVAIASVASALKLRAEHATPRPSAPAGNFDAGWKFALGDRTGAENAGYDDASWRAMTLPHDWSIEGAFAEDAPAKGFGAYLPTGTGWYRKTFVLDHDTAARRVEVVFEGVYQRSEVWINGEPLGLRPYGFSTFSYDLTPHLNRPGRPNVLAVRVDNSLQPNCRWYAGSGIYRHTWLRITDRLHIPLWGVEVRCTGISAGAATVGVVTAIRNDRLREATATLLTEVLSPGGVVVGSTRTAITAGPGGETRSEAHLAVQAPLLWSPASPALYRVRSTLLEGETRVGQETTEFGIREAVFDADQGFLLNGKRVKLNGVCLHGDGGCVGTAVPARVWERRLALLREMGCNAVRLAHNPADPDLLTLLDRMGFLVMAEAFDEWREPKAQTPVYGYHRYFGEWAERDLTAMVRRDRNHPSIVIWSLGNEVPDQTSPEGVITLKRLKALVQEHDGTRPVTVACDDIVAEPRETLPAFLAELDVVGYNYPDRWRDRREKVYSPDRQAYPRRRFVGTESTTVFGARGVYGSDQRNAMFPERESNTEIEVEQLEKFTQTYDYVSGNFLWTGVDYLGEASWPNKLAATGPLDTCGFRKDTYFFYKSLWTQEPVLHLATHWNWRGKEGQIVRVTCFSNCDTVELFLNGETFGVKGFAFPRPGMTETYGHYPPRGLALQTTADLHLSWDVPFRPGTLMARGMREGKVVETAVVETTGEPARLRLVADRAVISPTRSDVAHITIMVLDAAGRTVPTASPEFRVALTGEGRLLGLDSGQPDSHERYTGDAHTAFNGLALAIVQGTGRAGTMQLAVSSPGLESASVEITVR